MKIIAFYLPQFHSIPENDEWWGEGFTEWVNVKKAKPLFDGHEQPVVPFKKNYYNLLNLDTLKWQCNLANEYGIYGFCIYHYWFKGKKLLEKPLELLRNNKSLRTNYCICWANEHWTNQWVSKSEKILIEQEYGDKEDWIAHYNYLSSFFSDGRYIKEDNKPVLVIYRPEIIPCLAEMLSCWNEMAIKEGFGGIKFAFQHIGYDLGKKKTFDFDYDIEYQPMYSLTYSASKMHVFLKKIASFVNGLFKNNANIVSSKINKVRTISYDKLWNFIVTSKKIAPNSIPGAFVRWDNTPRKGTAGLVTTGVTPEKFEKYLTLQINRARDCYKSDKIFIFAWNEWAEGGYLEPDEKYGYSFLESLKKALLNCNEFPF